MTFFNPRWRDSEETLAEIDAMIADLQAGRVPSDIAGVYAPTGSTQEVSLSSGWAHEFIAQASRFDLANTEHVQSLPRT